MAQNYQELMLSTIQKNSIPVTVFLISGLQIRGTVIAFDNYVIVLECEQKQQMLYKHAISAIVPVQNPLKMPAIANPVSHDTDGAETPNVSTALDATGSVDVKRNCYINTEA